MSTKRSWDLEKDGVLSEENIRSRHQPASHFRISRSRYPSGTRFSGTMRRGVCYLMEGACLYDFGEPIGIRAGDIVELPGGNYSFEVVGTEDVDMVKVWELPPEFWSSSST